MALLHMPGGVLSMTADAAQALIRDGDGDAALLYLHLLSQGGVFLPEGARRALRWDEGRLERARARLAGLDLVPREAPAPAPAPLLPADEPPAYSSDDLAAELEQSGSPFPALVDEVQRLLGKLLSTAELKSLYTLYDYLSLPPEVILLLVSWCAEEMERKYGPGRKPRMPMIAKQGFIWKRLGVDSAEAAEAYLKRQTALRGREREVLSLIGASGRSPTERERTYIAAWLDMGFGDEALRMAYERTLFKKQNMDWGYMNGILRGWHSKGLHTPAEIEAGDRAYRAARPAAGAAPGGESAQRARRDLERMREYLRTQKEGE